MITNAIYSEKTEKDYLKFVDDFLESIPVGELNGPIIIKGKAIRHNPRSLRDLDEPERVSIRTTDLNLVKDFLERMRPASYSVRFEVGERASEGYERLPVVRVHGSEGRTLIGKFFGEGPLRHNLSIGRSYYKLQPVTSERTRFQRETYDAIEVIYSVVSAKTRGNN